jgi:hypothetical protein
MKRLEIIANSSVEDALLEAFEAKGVAQFYTKIPVVHGIGKSGVRRGDHVWPEENFLLIIYCDEDEAWRIQDIVHEVKEHFSDEGIKLFEVGE